jgi:hypothetical protein
MNAKSFRNIDSHKTFHPFVSTLTVSSETVFFCGYNLARLLCAEKKAMKQKLIHPTKRRFSKLSKTKIGGD